MATYREICTMCMLALALTACDTVYGVATEANLAYPVDIGCIDRTMRSIPDIGVVKHISSRNPNISQEIWEYGIGQSGSVRIIYNEAYIDYSNGRLRMAEPFSKSDLDSFIPLMDRVNAALEQSCGLPLRSAGRLRRN